MAFPVEYVVEYVASKSGKASCPKFFTVTLGFNTFKGIVKLSWFSVTNFLASSKLIAKSKPFSSLCISYGLVE